MKKNSLSDSKKLGRTVSEPDKLWLTNSCSGCEFDFSGKKLDLILGCGNKDDEKTIPFCNKPRIAVFVNGRIKIKKTITSSGERVNLVDSDIPQTWNNKRMD